MYRFFQRNQKKLLAVFGAFLMIVFILPGTVGSGRDRRTNPVVGYLGKEKLYAMEMGQARAEWDQLKRIPYPYSQYQFQRQSWVQHKLGRVANEIEESPELFLLLQKEALRQGIRVAPDRVDALLHAELEPGPNATQDERDRRRRAAESYLLVQSLYDRVGDNVKVSEPMVDRYLATVAQEVKLNLVEFRADDFKAATTAPTTQEVQEQFRKYASVAPGVQPLSATRPTTAPATLPFGYRYPDRVKLQYLAITNEQVRSAVRKSKSDYDWEVAAQRYYLSHLKDYQSTAPTPSPLGPAVPNLTGTPTTQPYEYVKAQVMEKVMQPEVERLTADVRSAVAKRMTTAWEQYRAQSGGATRPAGASSTAPAGSAPAGSPASAPATSPAASQPGGFPSFAFLEQLAADVQKQFGVLPAVTSKSDQWLTADELSKLPGIGMSHTTKADGRYFANYVLQSAEPFFPVPAKADPARVLSVLEPSEPLEDVDGNVYFFRLTDAQAAHAPTDVAEVREKVESDVVAGRAYARAAEEAHKLLEAAKKQGLAAAAEPTGRRVIATGNIGRGQMGPTTIPNYPTADAQARQAVVVQAYRLLADATPDHPHPVAVFELPGERKVLVAELAGVTSQLKDTQAFADRLYVARSIASREAQNLAADWFRADAVKSRLGYRSTDPEEDKRKQEERRKRMTEQAAAE